MIALSVALTFVACAASKQEEQDQDAQERSEQDPGASGGASSEEELESSSSGGSAGELTGAVATLGASCSDPGELACAGRNQRVALICGSDQLWERAASCTEGEFCSANVGPQAGTCRQPSELCAGQANHSACEGTRAIVCDPDGIDRATSENCADGCFQGKCTIEAEPCPEVQPGEFQTDCSGICEDGNGCHEELVGCPYDATHALAEYLWTETEGTLVHSRLPAASDLCLSETCGRPGFRMELDDGYRFAIQVPTGWGLVYPGVSEQGSMASYEESIPCESEPQEGCVEITTAEYGRHFVFFTPLEPGLGGANLRVTYYDQFSATPAVCK